jgi:hypothetical protein
MPMKNRTNSQAKFGGNRFGTVESTNGPNVVEQLDRGILPDWDESKFCQ